MAAKGGTKLLMVTANIASCFEQPDVMLKPWMNEFLKGVEEHTPHFVALHCQEVGGKNYEESMQHVDDFIKALASRGTMLPYDKVRIFIDEEYSIAEKFTALGNFYFVRQDVDDVHIWDFEEKTFKPVEGRQEFSGNIEDVTVKEKSKFPQEFFPECKWSRKGFMRTRWQINGTQFDCVNIHLFHDASNIIAMEESPSQYCLNRKRALEHTLDRFHNDGYDNIPFFMFGDFNFRVDTKGVVAKLTEGCTMEDREQAMDGEKAHSYVDKNKKEVLAISKKAFLHQDHVKVFLKDNGNWMKEFDKELKQFGNRLCEFPITFPPSYPFEEGIEGDALGNHYMPTRCPSWCDRVILNSAAKSLVEKGSKHKYNLFGLNTRMGDHKPIGLSLEIRQNAGSVSCCVDNRPCQNYVHDLNAKCYTHSEWCYCQSSLPMYPRPPSCTSPNPSYTQIRRACLDKLDPKNQQDNTPNICINLQCACTTQTNDAFIESDCQCGHDTCFKITYIIDEDNLDKLTNITKEELILKRVHSEPFPNRDCKNPIHHTLISTMSLDEQKANKQPPVKLRLRASSSRHISHHSSSTEEWFEEVPIISVETSCNDLESSQNKLNDYECNEETKLIPPPFPELGINKDKPPPSPISHRSIISNDGDVKYWCSNKSEDTDTNKSLKIYLNNDPQHSLNNLLLTDSCDRLSTSHYNRHCSESSLSALYSEDTSSYTSRPPKDSETVSQAPTFDIAEVDCLGKKSSKLPCAQRPKTKTNSKSKRCCIVL